MRFMVEEGLRWLGGALWALILFERVSHGSVVLYGIYGAMGHGRFSRERERDKHKREKREIGSRLR